MASRPRTRAWKEPARRGRSRARAQATCLRLKSHVRQEAPALAAFGGVLKVFHGDGRPPHSALVARARAGSVECFKPPCARTPRTRSLPTWASRVERQPHARASANAHDGARPGVTSRRHEQYGTHHSKAIVVIRPTSLSVHVTTANFIYSDWRNKTNATWSASFPRLATPPPRPAEETFGADLLGVRGPAPRMYVGVRGPTPRMYVGVRGPTPRMYVGVLGPTPRMYVGVHGPTPRIHARGACLHARMRARGACLHARMRARGAWPHPRMRVDSARGPHARSPRMRLTHAVVERGEGAYGCRSVAVGRGADPSLAHPVHVSGTPPCTSPARPWHVPGTPLARSSHAQSTPCSPALVL